MKDERAATADQTKALLAQMPEVRQCYYVTGGVSFVLVIIAPNMPSYEALTRKLFAENDLVVDFRTLITLDRVEAGTAVAPP